jgi:hypothetical protein
MSTPSENLDPMSPGDAGETLASVQRRRAAAWLGVG